MIVGSTKLDRKRSLAGIVASHLVSLGHQASVIENRVNSRGHKDLVLVESDLGLIHLTASINQEPGGSILASDVGDGSQDFLADKSLVAYGWIAKDGRTIVMFVPVDAVKGNRAMTKDQIRAASIREYNAVFGTQRG